MLDFNSTYRLPQLFFILLIAGFARPYVISSVVERVQQILIYLKMKLAVSMSRFESS